MLAFFAHALEFEEVFHARDRIAQHAIGVVELRAALQRDFFFAFRQVHKTIGMQFPAELQKFLFQAIHAEP